jgi:hypothetical protein
MCTVPCSSSRHSFGSCECSFGSLRDCSGADEVHSGTLDAQSRVELMQSVSIFSKMHLLLPLEYNFRNYCNFFCLKDDRYFVISVNFPFKQ